MLDEQLCTRMSLRIRPRSTFTHHVHICEGILGRGHNSNVIFLNRYSSNRFASQGQICVIEISFERAETHCNLQAYPLLGFPYLCPPSLEETTSLHRSHSIHTGQSYVTESAHLGFRFHAWNPDG